jgi:hypothetical protein
MDRVKILELNQSLFIRERVSDTNVSLAIETKSACEM